MYRGQKFHSSARNYKWNLERRSNSSQSIRPQDACFGNNYLTFLKSESKTSIFWVLSVKSFWQYMGRSYKFNLVNIIFSDIRNFISTYYSLMFFIAYAFKGQVHVFAGWVKLVSHLSCRTNALLKYFCLLMIFAYWIVYENIFKQKLTQEMKILCVSNLENENLQMHEHAFQHLTSQPECLLLNGNPWKKYWLINQNHACWVIFYVLCCHLLTSFFQNILF